MPGCLFPPTHSLPQCRSISGLITRTTAVVGQSPLDSSCQPGSGNRVDSPCCSSRGLQQPPLSLVSGGVSTSLAGSSNSAYISINSSFIEKPLHSKVGYALYFLLSPWLTQPPTFKFSAVHDTVTDLGIAIISLSLESSKYLCKQGHHISL